MLILSLSEWAVDRVGESITRLVVSRCLHDAYCPEQKEVQFRMINIDWISSPLRFRVPLPFTAPTRKKMGLYTSTHTHMVETVLCAGLASTSKMGIGEKPKSIDSPRVLKHPEFYTKVFYIDLVGTMFDLCLGYLFSV